MNTNSDRILIKNATILTIDAANRVIEGAVAIEQGRIAAILPKGASIDETAFDEILDARGSVLLPGFVQSHIHLCQTLFRGAADDLALIEWLRERVWPMEAAHTPDSLSASARLGIAEMIKGGTTSALTMETVRHTAAVFRAVEDSGFRATVGKCMMDAGEGVPAALNENTADSIAESVELLKEWNGRADGRIRYCFAPRFAVSCTRELLEAVARLAREFQVPVHTHASENQDEIAIVERNTGMRNIEYLREVGLTGSHVILAHCIWVNEAEMEILRRDGTHVAHCPSSNLKLASGLAQVIEMVDRGISVSLGADGAPCNNRLDMFTEMRSAGLLQKARRGCRTMPAAQLLRMATMGGAHALGLADEIGSIEAGKRADLILVNLDRLHTTPAPDPVSTIVYAAEAADVETVLIDGRIVMRDRRLLTLDEKSVIQDARHEAVRLMERVAQA